QGANGAGFGVILSSNKVNSYANAYIENSGETAEDYVLTIAGATAVTAVNQPHVSANTKMVASSVTTNDGGASIIEESLNDLFDADYVTTPSAEEGLDTNIRDVRFGDRVRLADDYAVPDYVVDDLVI